MNAEQSKFEGWALVNVLGHQSHVGYVTTEYYGSSVLFRVATPELPAQEFVEDEDCYVSGRWVEKGHKVTIGAVPPSVVLVGAGSIYSIVPATEEKVFEHMRQNFNPPVLSVTAPDGTRVGDKEHEMTF